MKKQDYLIRKDCEADCSGITALLAHSSVFPFLGTPPFLEEAQFKSIYTARGREDVGFVCVVDENIVGFVQLLRVHPAPRRSHAFTMMVAVLPEFRKKGIATALVKAVLGYADQWIACKRIEFVVDAENTPAIDLYKKYGFEVEGTHKSYILREGDLVDVVAMARVKAS